MLSGYFPFPYLDDQAQYHSQRREHPARSERPVSNFYEYESVQGLQGMHGRQPSLGSQGSGHLSQGSGHHQTGLPSGTNMPAGYRTVSPPRHEMSHSHYNRADGPPPYARQPTKTGDGRPVTSRSPSGIKSSYMPSANQLRRRRQRYHTPEVAT